MGRRKMHENEIDVGTEMVSSLVADQFPGWASYDIAAVPSSGTDNALFRLGNDLVLRFPRIDWAVPQIAKEQRWLSHLATGLTLEIPEPVAIGEPGAGYPWRWSVYRWIEGEPLTMESPADPVDVARVLARFLLELRAIDPAGGPAPGDSGTDRGIALSHRHENVLHALEACEGLIDAGRARIAWQEALSALPWDGPGVWVHGDLQPGNVLTTGGQVTAVIDWGCLGVGDPAVDLLIAWNYLTGAARQTFREALGVDDVMWARGRGWALSVALIALPYYLHTNEALAEQSRRVIAAVLEDQRSRSEMEHR